MIVAPVQQCPCPREGSCGRHYDSNSGMVQSGGSFIGSVCCTICRGAMLEVVDRQLIARLCLATRRAIDATQDDMQAQL